MDRGGKYPGVLFEAPTQAQNAPLSLRASMAEAEILQRQLAQAQNHDGGWGYRNGSSWTEPTALALLALQAHTSKEKTCEQGFLWLQRNQRFDGGWPPNPSVDVSTWVTSLAALALSQINGMANSHERAIQWLVRQIEPETDPIRKAVFRFCGVTAYIPAAGGSPWFPGTAAWVAPTAMSILALSDAAHSDPRLASYVRDGQRFILSRRCRDGGWNHGGSLYLNENAASYPEMTGIALLALHGIAASELLVPLKIAENHLRFPGSIEGLSWLQLALSRHGRDVGDPATGLVCRNTRDVSLRLLMLAGNNGRNKLLGPI
jgi:hypothetical protein